MKRIAKILVSSAAALSMASSAFAAVPIGGTAYIDDETVTFIVEVEGDALLASEEASELGTDYINTDEAKEQEQQLLKTQAAVKSSIKKEAKVKSSVGYTYTAVLNGFSIEAPKSKLDEIKAIDGVKNVAIAIPLEPNLISSVELASSLPEQTADEYSETGYTGEGQVVAIIDSEFDTGHEFFSHAPENPKLSKSDIADVLEENTMNVDIAANQVYRSEKIPFAYDYINETADTYHTDTDEIHGTHVAGIAAGKNGSLTTTEIDGTSEYTFSGVAPEAQLVLMKVSDSNGEIDMAAAAAALDDAVKIGVCAVNMSFGGQFMSDASVDYMLDEAFANARNAGVMLLVSEGNSGIGYSVYTADTDTPDYSSVGIPASNSAATAVASLNNTHIGSSLGILTAADGSKYYYQKGTDDSTFAEDYAGKTVEYADCGGGTEEECAQADVSGKIALITRNSTTFASKAANAQAAGAEAVIFYNTSDGIDELPVLQAACIPTVLIEKSSGEALKNMQDKRITISEINPVYSESSSAGTASYFTSLGVDETLELKPEIMAPGGNIYSSVPDDKYESKSGTSMAAPHMTGIVALMNEYLDKSGSNLAGGERVSTIENMLMSSADIVYQPENTEGEVVPYSPRLQGAGFVNTAAAMNTSAVFVGNSGKSKISLGDGIDDTFTLDFTVKNITNTAVTYDDLSLDVTTDGYQTDDDGNTYVVPDNAVGLTVVSSSLPESVTIPANSEVSLSVNVTLDKDELSKNSEVFTNGFYIDGFVTFASTAEGVVTISMPFTGFRGDWTSQPIFDKTMYDEGGSDLAALGGTFLYSTCETDGDVVYAILGMNDNGEYDKDRIAISPNGDAMGDALGMELISWRAIDNLTMELFGGEVYIKSTAESVYPKFTAETSELEGVSELSEEELPDGEYTFRVSGAFNYDGAETESFELPVIVDRVKPEITRVTIDGDTLYVTASDNNYLYSVIIDYIDENGEAAEQSCVPDSERGGEYTAEFDISGLDTDDITISVMDTALNEAEAALANALGTVIAESAGCTSEGGMTSAEFKLTNTGESDIDGDAILAFYDEDGVLIAADIQSVSIGAGEVLECTFQMFADTSEAAEYSLYIWDSANGMIPLDTAKSF